MELCTELEYFKRFYDENNIIMSDLQMDGKSHSYKFKLNGKNVIYRCGKITPIKMGYFVTLYKRNLLLQCVPFDYTDDVDFYIIGLPIINKQFIFTKNTLADNGIISRDNKNGKRGFRLYHPHIRVNSKQALNSQEWQSKCFIDNLKDYYNNFQN